MEDEFGPVILTEEDKSPVNDVFIRKAELARLRQIEAWAREAVKYIEREKIYWKVHFADTPKEDELLTQAKSLGLLEDE